MGEIFKSLLKLEDVSERNAMSFGTIKIVNQTVRSKDKSQQIAVLKLLYWIQHLDQYSSRMQEILRPDVEPELSG